MVFLIDGYTDVEPQPAVKEIIDIAIDAIKNPRKPRPEGEIVVGEILRQLVGFAIGRRHKGHSPAVIDSGLVAKE